MITSTIGGEYSAPLAANLLSDATLLQICRVDADNTNIAPEWLADLRLVVSLAESAYAQKASALEGAMALLASLLGQLPEHNPVHLPFGYDGPTIRSRGWLDRQTLELVGQQVVGLVWNQSDPEAVSSAVHEAISKSLRLGFMEQEEYDAWRPGMPSGSGWRSAVKATLYGATRARYLTDATGCGTTQRAQAGKAVVPATMPSVKTEPLIHHQTASQGNGDEIKPPQQRCFGNESSKILTPAGDSPSFPANIQKAAVPLTVEKSTGETTGPAVKLARRGEPCYVLGKQKRPLTDAQYSVIQALQEAGEDGMSKDALEAVRPSARRILKNLRCDADWANVIIMPGQTNGRYRIRS